MLLTNINYFKDSLDNFKHYVNAGGYQTSSMIILHGAIKGKGIKRMKKCFNFNDKFLLKELYTLRTELCSIYMKDILVRKYNDFKVKPNKSELALEIFFPNFANAPIHNRKELIDEIVYRLDRYYLDNFIF